MGWAAGKPALTELVEPPRAGLPTTGRGYVTILQGRRRRSRNSAAEIVCRRPWPGRAGRRRRGVETVTITRRVRRCRCRRTGGPRACVWSIIYHHHHHRRRSRRHHTHNTYFVGCGPIASAAHPPLTDALDSHKYIRLYYRFFFSIWKLTHGRALFRGSGACAKRAREGRGRGRSALFVKVHTS